MTTIVVKICHSGGAVRAVLFFAGLSSSSKKWATRKAWEGMGVRARYLQRGLLSDHTTDNQWWIKQMHVLWKATCKTKETKKKEKKTHNAFLFCRNLDCNKLTQNLLPSPCRCWEPAWEQTSPARKRGCIQPSPARMFKSSKSNAQRQPAVFIKYQQKNYGRYRRNLNHLMPCNLCQITKKNIAWCQFFWLMWSCFTFLWSFS